MTQLPDPQKNRKSRQINSNVQSQANVLGALFVSKPSNIVNYILWERWEIWYQRRSRQAKQGTVEVLTRREQLLRESTTSRLGAHQYQEPQSLNTRLKGDARTVGAVFPILKLLDNKSWWVRTADFEWSWHRKWSWNVLSHFQYESIQRRFSVPLSKSN